MKKTISTLIRILHIAIVNRVFWFFSKISSFSHCIPITCIINIEWFFSILINNLWVSLWCTMEQHQLLYWPLIIELILQKYFLVIILFIDMLILNSNQFNYFPSSKCLLYLSKFLSRWVNLKCSDILILFLPVLWIFHFFFFDIWIFDHKINKTYQIEQIILIDSRKYHLAFYLIVFYQYFKIHWTSLDVI